MWTNTGSPGKWTFDTTSDVPGGPIPGTPEPERQFLLHDSGVYIEYKRDTIHMYTSGITPDENADFDHATSPLHEATWVKTAVNSQFAELDDDAVWLLMAEMADIDAPEWQRPTPQNPGQTVMTAIPIPAPAEQAGDQ
jgi:hypothetical protein